MAPPSSDTPPSGGRLGAGLHDLHDLNDAMAAPKGAKGPTPLASLDGPPCCESPAAPPDDIYSRLTPAVAIAAIAALLMLWLVVYSSLIPVAEWITFSVFGFSPDSHLGEAVRFFIYDTPKVLLLLVLVVYGVGVARSYFTPESTRRLLAGKRVLAGHVAAAGLGVLTPFCSCSAVPLFIGFITARVPLGVAFSFIIAAPMVNEVALALLFGLFGWKVAVLYAGLGLAVAIGAGFVIGRLGMDDQLQDWVRLMHAEESDANATAAPALGWRDRLRAGHEAVVEILAKVWPFVVAGIAAGALIHGYVPEDTMAAVMGKEAWWSVPLAVIMGVPMYTNAAGVIPVLEALLAKGAALGTVLAFMMSVIALSLPEMLILRRVLKTRLIITFACVVATGILLVGYLFNIIL